MCDLHLKKIPKNWKTVQRSNEPKCLGVAEPLSEMSELVTSTELEARDHDELIISGT